MAVYREPCSWETFESNYPIPFENVSVQHTAVTLSMTHENDMPVRHRPEGILNKCQTLDDFLSMHLELEPTPLPVSFKAHSADKTRPPSIHFESNRGAIGEHFVMSPTTGNPDQGDLDEGIKSKRSGAKVVRESSGVKEFFSLNVPYMCKSLTPYNYFYRDERDNIVNGTKKAGDPLPPPLKDFSQARQNALLHQHW